jgi:hypothetical protein
MLHPDQQKFPERRQTGEPSAAERNAALVMLRDSYKHKNFSRGEGSLTEQCDTKNQQTDFTETLFGQECSH